MILNKEDLSQIKDVVHGEVESAVDELARIVNKGFEQTATKTEVAGLKNDIARLELEIMEVKERIILLPQLLLTAGF